MPSTPRSRKRRNLSRRAVSSVLILILVSSFEVGWSNEVFAKVSPSLVVTSAPSDRAAPSSRQAAARAEIEREFKAAGARYSASDYLGAIAGFTQCLTLYEVNSLVEPVIRGALLFNLGKSYEKAFETERDARYLRLAKDTYARYIDEAERGAKYEDVALVKTRLHELGVVLETKGSEPVAESEVPVQDSDLAVDPRAVEEQHDTAPAAAIPPPLVDNAAKSEAAYRERLLHSSRRNRRVGIGLLCGGGGAFAVSAGTLAAGILEGDAYLSSAGIVFALAGTALVITGGVLLGKSKRQQRRAATIPVRVGFWAIPALQGHGGVMGASARF